MISGPWSWLAAGTAAVAVAAWRATRGLTVTRHRIGDADGRDPLRLVQLSDLHLRSFDGLARRAADTVHGLEPDLILFTGDSIEAPEGLLALERMLERIHAPGFAVVGNWEYRGGVEVADLHAAYARREVRLLVNETVEVDTRRGPVAVVGLDPAVKIDVRTGRAWSGSVAGDRRVAIAHMPGVRGVFDPEDEATPLWMAAGHTHGGQVRLPGWVPTRSTRRRAYVSGWYRNRRPWLYVSRGIGTSHVPVRLFAPPEIAVFDWWPA